MTEEQKISAIKRINQGIADLTKGSVKFDYAAERAKEKLAAIIPQEYLTKSGNISHSAKAIKNIPDAVIESLEKLPKRGDITKDIKKKIATEEWKSAKAVTMQEVQTYVDIATEIRRLADETPSYISDAISTVNPSFIGGGQKPSYAQLKSVVNDYKQKFAETLQINRPPPNVAQFFSDNNPFESEE